MKNVKNRSSIGVMLGLVGMVKPLLPIMLVAITMGCIGNLMATFITVLGGYGIGILCGAIKGSFGVVIALIIIFAVLRGILRYTEQASNHFIAFKLLARIRHLVFASLRRLAPAKLDGANKGNLISIITSDIELLEVFYAHTISPIVIAFVTSLVMSLYIGHFNVTIGLIACCFYIVVGVLIPIINSKLGTKDGQVYRKLYGDLNTNVLDNLYGLTEILQFQQEKERSLKMNSYSDRLEETNSKLKSKEAGQRISTDIVIMVAGFVIFSVGSTYCMGGHLSWTALIICTIAMMSSFGPTAALSNLSNNLNQTLASGNRVLNLLEEEPILEDVVNGKEMKEGPITFEDLEFTYLDSTNGIKLDYLKWEPKKIYGILGKSGCGKSTLLKLMMRFYETDKGAVKYNGTNVNEINTASLRDNISYVTQETFLFGDTIENNIKVAKLDATREEVIEAAKKASIHDFIMSLPKGYDTRLAELGDSVSGGERQRIGVARAFLHDANIILLDEPTSNIDSLNEGIILEALEREKEDKTIILVSHRKSTMGIVDEEMCM